MRSWVTEPGAESMPSTYMVWIESTITRRGAPAWSKVAIDVADRGRRRQLHRGAREAETRRAQPELVDQFLAADIGHGLAAPRQRGAGLQRQGGLADAGIAADQDRRALDQAAAQHPVELLDAGGQPRRRGGGAAQADQLERAAGGAQALGDGLGAASSARLFHSPQASQRPDHLACQAPQLPQT